MPARFDVNRQGGISISFSVALAKSDMLLSSLVVEIPKLTLLEERWRGAPLFHERKRKFKNRPSLSMETMSAPRLLLSCCFRTTFHCIGIAGPTNSRAPCRCRRETVIKNGVSVSFFVLVELSTSSRLSLLLTVQPRIEKNARAFG